MGCASSKPKRTKSLDDLKGQAQNGQITKEDNTQKKPISQDKNTTANPIQIPGANKSFQAPDGIPFIDEDVDEEDARLRSGIRENSKKVSDERTSALVVNGGGDPRINTKITTVAVEDVIVDERGVRVIGQDGTVVPIKKGPAPSPQIDIQVPKHSSAAEEKAAVKIQAGIRGFLDRKKVQHIKEQKQQPQACMREPAKEVIVPPMKITLPPPQPQQPHSSHLKFDEETAATKIQANFKGYKTRKELAAASKK